MYDPLICNIQNRKSIETECRAGEEEKILNGYWVSFWGDKNVLELVVMVAQHCECIECH